MSHTSGPWSVTQEPYIFNGDPVVATRDGQGLIVCYVRHSGHGNGAGELGDPLDDAILIAQAPDMLDRLRWIRDRAHKAANGGFVPAGKRLTVGQAKQILREIAALAEPAIYRAANGSDAVKAEGALLVGAKRR